jgi:hypothetical protein
MALLVVSYELSAPEHKYPALTHELERLRASHILLSTWAVRAKSSADALRDHLWKFLDADCRLLVVDATKAQWAAENTLSPLSDH